tara:strand:- start:29301 stop:29423 length:123 start_codon:yes stop_codon:yes gene_type:complete
MDESYKKKILKKLGAFSFLFFLIKGLLWIIIPLLAYLGLK